MGQENTGVESKMASRFILIIIIATCAFAYGLVVATYKVFPFSQLQYAKSLIIEEPDVTINPVEAREIERSRFYYLNKRSFFDSHSAQADIVMVGDSLVDGAEWHEILPNASIVNRGIRGDSIEGVLNRMDSVYSVGATKAFLMVGYNDLRQSRPATEVFEHYKLIVEGLLAHDIQPYIQSVILVGEHRIEWNKYIMQLNALLENYATEKGLVFIDLNTFLTVNGELNPAFSKDGIHLNGEGYAVWARAIEPHIGIQ